MFYLFIGRERNKDYYILETWNNLKAWLSIREKLKVSHDYLFVNKYHNTLSIYEIECVKNNWSLREFERQLNSSLFERLLLSTDKSKVKELAIKGQIIEKPEDAIKDPYVLEFLGLPELPSYSEAELETKIIDNLEDFLLELGKGFTFVARQQRFTFEEEHFKVDLVFYNRILRCFVLFDLKIDKLTLPEDNTQIFASKYQEILTKLSLVLKKRLLINLSLSTA